MNDQEQHVLSAHFAEGATLDDAGRARVREKFLKSFPIDLEADPQFLDRELDKAARNRDGTGLEYALLLGFLIGGFEARHARVLSEVLTEDWHTQHEDIASLLQDLSSPETAQALYYAATKRFEYLDYDEWFGLARKCTWAIADIGTPVAKELLQALSLNENTIIAGYAQKRLDHWQDEAGRKGIVK